MYNGYLHKLMMCFVSHPLTREKVRMFLPSFFFPSISSDWSERLSLVIPINWTLICVLLIIAFSNQKFSKIEVKMPVYVHAYLHFIFQFKIFSLLWVDHAYMHSAIYVSEVWSVFPTWTTYTVIHLYFRSMANFSFICTFLISHHLIGEGNEGESHECP